MTPEEIVLRIQQTKRRLESLRNFLESRGFEFQCPGEVLPGPDLHSPEVMAKIERAAGQVPDAIRQFYSIIGSVNFNGHHPHWNGCDYSDALIVFPVVFAEEELANFLSDREEYLGAYGSFRIPVAPDYYHKEGVSGGMWYGVPVPAESADPPLLEEPHSTTFLRYLEIALSWGGFPGLEHANLNHTWPLSDLRNAASEPSVPLNGASATPWNNSAITEGPPSVS